jgi:5-methyltetrahydropteroyltriglutamate--homocysteine methyltransferase
MSHANFHKGHTMTIRNHTLGFPRVGLRRELKKAQESYWAGNATREELLAVGRELRARHWDQQKQAGVDLKLGDWLEMPKYGCL